MRKILGLVIAVFLIITAVYASEERFWKNGRYITHTEDCQIFFNDSHMVGVAGSAPGTSKCSCESGYTLDTVERKCVANNNHRVTSTPSEGNSNNDSDNQNSNQPSNHFSGVLCPSNLILHQNLRAPRYGYVRNGRYDWYTKGIVREVKILQRHLNRLGFSAGPVDGVIGPLTRGAILRLQEYLGTTQDGYVGPITRNLLNHSCEATNNSNNSDDNNDDDSNSSSSNQEGNSDNNEESNNSSNQNNHIAIDGSCGNLKYSCTAGSVDDMNATYTNGKIRFTWKCLGRYNGNNVNCSIDEDIDGVNNNTDNNSSNDQDGSLNNNQNNNDVVGVCGTVQFTCESGTVANQETWNAAGHVNYAWYCRGTNRSGDRYCSKMGEAVGSENNNTDNSSNNNSSSSNDTNNTNNDSLNNQNQGNSVTGTCGTTVNSCIAGSLNDGDDSLTQYRWYCQGTGGATLCTINKNVVTSSTKIVLNCSDNSTAAQWYKSKGRCGEQTGIDYWNNTLAIYGENATKTLFDDAYKDYCSSHFNINISSNTDWDSLRACNSKLLCNDGWDYDTNTNYCVKNN